MADILGHMNVCVCLLDIMHDTMFLIIEIFIIIYFLNLSISYKDLAMIDLIKMSAIVDHGSDLWAVELSGCRPMGSSYLPKIHFISATHIFQTTCDVDFLMNSLFV